MNRILSSLAGLAVAAAGEVYSVERKKIRGVFLHFVQCLAVATVFAGLFVESAASQSLPVDQYGSACISYSGQRTLEGTGGYVRDVFENSCDATILVDVWYIGGEKSGT